MPRFTIIEKVTCTIEVDAPDAQAALDGWVTNAVGELTESVDERWVEDAKGNVCEVHQ